MGKNEHQMMETRSRLNSGFNLLVSWHIMLLIIHLSEIRKWTELTICRVEKRLFITNELRKCCESNSDEQKAKFQS